MYFITPVADLPWESDVVDCPRQISTDSCDSGIVGEAIVDALIPSGSDKLYSGNVSCNNRPGDSMREQLLIYLADGPWALAS